MLRKELVVACVLLVFSFSSTFVAGQTVWGQIESMLDEDIIEAFHGESPYLIDFEYGAQEVVSAAADLYRQGGSAPCADVLAAVNNLKGAVWELSEQPTAYPATRRLVLNALATKYRDLPTHCEEEFQLMYKKILSRMHSINTAARALRGDRLAVLHPSGSGGITLCQLAKQLKMNTENYDQNCRITQFGDGPSWMRSSSGLVAPWIRTDGNQADCDTRSQVLKANEWTFYMNEYALPSLKGVAGVCTDTLNVLMFRNPLVRGLVHVQALHKGLAKVTADAGNLPRSFNDLAALSPQLVDNYYIRTLLGKEVFESDMGTVTRRHLQQAKWKLMQFDAVLLLEEPPKAEVIVRSITPLDRTSFINKAFSSELQSGMQLDAIMLRKDELEALASNLTYASFNLDFELYMFAAKMFNLDYQFASYNLI